MKDSLAFIELIEESLFGQFKAFETTSYRISQRITEAYQEAKVESRHFSPSTGYGYSDIAREKLEEVFAKVFGAEAALVRPHFASATHAIVVALRGLLEPRDVLYSVCGAPYDTIATAIGKTAKDRNTLRAHGVEYKQTDLMPDGSFDTDNILKTIKEDKIKLLFLQRSRGYAWRKSLNIAKITELCKEVKAVDKDVIIVVDNCYGEFTEISEPTHVGADVCMGSLIKNPGGGLAPTGAYIVGRDDLIQTIADGFISPGIGGEIGSYESSYRPFFQGLFMAPHTVAQCLKGAALFAAAYEKLGYTVMPKANDARSDITQSIQLGSADKLIAFCQAIQSASPIEGHVMPMPWDMPGYEDEVIMAAGTFVQGASIELSADGPIREPYTAYLQGGLTYEHCRLALKKTLDKM